MNWVGVVDMELLRKQADTLEALTDQDPDEDLVGILMLLDSILKCEQPE